MNKLLVALVIFTVIMASGPLLKDAKTEAQSNSSAGDELIYDRGLGNHGEYTEITGNNRYVFSYPYDKCSAISPSGVNVAQSSLQSEDLVIRQLISQGVIVDIPWDSSWQPCAFKWVSDTIISTYRMDNDTFLTYDISSGTLTPISITPQSTPQPPSLPDWAQSTQNNFVLQSPDPNIYLYERCNGLSISPSGDLCSSSIDFVIYNVQTLQTITVLANPDPFLLRGTDATDSRKFASSVATWSNNGRYLAYQQYAESSYDYFGLQIYDLNLNQYQDIQGANQAIDDQRAMQWSNTGNKLALWIIGRLGEPEPTDNLDTLRSLVIYDADTGIFTATNQSFDIDPLDTGKIITWSPDGMNLVFIDQSNNLIKVDVNSGMSSILDADVTEIIVWKTSSINLTPTPLPTNTDVPTSTATFTPTNTPTSTNTATFTPTDTPTTTFTPTPTSTATFTPTSTPTSTATYTPTSTPIPPAMNGKGLRVQYFDNLNFVTPKYYVLTSTVNFNWAASGPVGIGVDTFSARWTGKIEPLYSETYTFYVTHDDGARLWVNGQQLVNNWTNAASAITDSGTITLTAGVKYDITLEYYENTGNTSVKLEWQSANQARQVVPSTQLYGPEGQLIFTGQTSGNDNVYVINPDGTGTVTIANSTSADHGGVWSPDGTQVAFVSQRDGNEEIYMANADGTGLRRLTNNAAFDRAPCWSPDGTKIVFDSGRTGNGDIYSIAITGTGVPTAVRLTTSTNNEYHSMYSPVGTKITFTQDTTTTGPDIFMMNPDGTSVVQLTTRNGNDVTPFWSPDGTKIAIRSDVSGRGQIYIVTVSPVTLVQATNTATGTNYFESWSPDSSKILFMSTRTGNAEIFSMNATGNYTNNNQTNLTNTTLVGESYAVWSPDARSIAYSRDNHIWLMNTDGSNQHQLTNVAGRTDYEISWWQPLQGA